MIVRELTIGTVIIADEGKTLRRKHDGFIIGELITLGNDYSTGVERKDKPEYYEEIDIPAEEEDILSEL